MHAYSIKAKPAGGTPKGVRHKDPPNILNGNFTRELLSKSSRSFLRDTDLAG